MATKKSGKVTIVDVAREVGMSHATVSRVLNNTGYIKESTRQLVLEAVERLGYVANQQARSLAGASSNLIGLLLPSLLPGYATQLTLYVDAELISAGYDVVVFTNHSAPEREKSLIERTTSGLLDGLIVMVLGLPETYLDLLGNQNIPYVLIGSEQHTGRQPVVGQTNWQGAYDATQHLIQLGHRRIAILRGPDGRASSLNRIAGHKAALTDHGIEFDETLMCDGKYTRQIAYQVTNQLLDIEHPPTAIFAANDDSAIGAMNAARDRGFNVPDGLSIVGFDDIEQSEIVVPHLTTVHVPLDSMAREAVRMLVERIKDPAAPVRTVTLATRLIIRESTAPPQERE